MTERDFAAEARQEKVKDLVALVTTLHRDLRIPQSLAGYSRSQPRSNWDAFARTVRPRSRPGASDETVRLCLAELTGEEVAA